MGMTFKKKIICLLCEVIYRRKKVISKERKEGKWSLGVANS